jgi:hypothetical protein
MVAVRSTLGTVCGVSRSLGQGTLADGTSCSNVSIFIYLPLAFYLRSYPSDLLICIHDTTTTSLGLRQNAAGGPTVNTGIYSSQSQNVLYPNTVFLEPKPSLQQMSDGNQILRDATAFQASPRLAQFLLNTMDPVGLCFHRWKTFSLGYFTLDCISGPVIVRNWSPSGKEVYKRLPAKQGYAAQLTIQLTRFVPGRISVTWYGMISGVPFPRVNLHSYPRWAGLF